MQVRSPGREDPLEEGMAAHSSILAWRIPRTEEPGGPQSMGSQRVRHGWATEHTCFLPCWEDQCMLVILRVLDMSLLLFEDSSPATVIEPQVRLHLCRSLSFLISSQTLEAITFPAIWAILPYLHPTFYACFCTWKSVQRKNEWNWFTCLFVHRFTYLFLHSPI